jgi:uncharacterized protein
MGAIINCVAVILGGTVGLVVGRFLPERIRTGVPVAFGLVCFGIGASLFVKVNGFLIVAVSIAVGTLLGEWLDIDKFVQRGTQKLQNWLSRRSWGDLPADKREKFATTFTSLLVLFCAGPVALIGGLREGLTGDFSILAAKAVLDLVTAAIFANALGVGVLILALPILLVEGVYILCAGLLTSVLSERMITEVSACAGLILIGTGLRILELKTVRTLNMLPALLLAPFVTLLFAR